ncbi:MAG TPA: class I SAM-dependent methyltransferase [Geodermatophilus sp.]|nr:class I SAM-dependent methyltransferase [Geodermatophilus sp.]
MPVPIDVHAPANRGTYGGRDADASWRDAVRAGLDPAGLDVADVGCGGGVYSRAWSELGAASVVGVDSSAVMLSAAEEETGGTGVGGLTELGVELEPERRGRGAGAALVAAALQQVPAGEPGVAAAAPGNAAGLRVLLAAGFLPVGSLQLFRR